MFDAVFAFLNFGVLSVFFYYGWIRIIVPGIHSLVQKQASDKEALHDEHRSLCKEYQLLDQSIVQQEEECKTLSAKVSQWKDAVEKKRIKERVDQDFLYTNYKQKIEERTVKLRTIELYKRIKPKVLAQVESELRATFGHDEKARMYLDYVLRGLRS